MHLVEIQLSAVRVHINETEGSLANENSRMNHKINVVFNLHFVPKFTKTNILEIFTIFSTMHVHV